MKKQSHHTLLLTLIVLLFTPVLHSMEKQPFPQNVRVGDLPEDYQRLGLNRDRVEIHEDGTNTRGADGTYEWWYFDAAMDDGSSLVLVFYTRSMMNPNSPLAPFATLEWHAPDGTVRSERVNVPASGFSASENQCEVRIGNCGIRGDLKEYELHFEKGDIKVDATLKSNAPSWRQDTGYRFYGNHDEHYAAWLCVVPEGDVTATVTVGDKTTRHTGSGYHDHNWGNHPLWKMQNHWYWGRAKVGPYVAITSNITTGKDYGFKKFTTFLLVKDGKIIADDPERVAFAIQNPKIDEKTGISIPDDLTYEYAADSQRYRIAYRRAETILAASMLAALTDAQKQEAIAAGNKMAYFRFTGPATIEQFEKDQSFGSFTATSAVWELMFPGIPDGQQGVK